MANLQRTSGKEGQHGRVFGNLPQHTCASLRSFIEKNLPPVLV
jgi:hypothetical protein